MILQIIQSDKSLYGAEFQIFCGNNRDVNIGSIVLTGHMGSMEAEICIDVFNRCFRMELGREFRLVKERRIAKRKRTYRSYDIFDDSSKNVGSVAQICERTSLFSEFYYHQLLFDGVEYEIYPVDFVDGGKNPIYSAGVQVAQIDTPCEILKDIHTYKVYAENMAAGVVSALSVAYMYLLAGFKPGIKATPLKEIHYSVTKDRVLLSKYDAGFAEKIKMESEGENV